MRLQIPYFSFSEPTSESALSNEPTPEPMKFARADLLLALGFSLLGLILVLSTYRGFGFSWDEAYYMGPAKQTRAWLGLMLHNWPKPIHAAEINWFFGSNADLGESVNIPELPMLPKLLMAVGLYLGDWLGIHTPYISMRIPIACCYALTLFFLYLLGHRFYGRGGAVLATLCYLTLPRLFGHAHIAATETILICFSMMFTYAFIRGLDHWKWSIISGILFGLCLATKFNALFLPITLVLWAQLFHRHKYSNNIFCLLFISPVVMVLVWPYLWPDPAARFVSYLSFFLQHSFIPTVYFGVKYPYPPQAPTVFVPLSYPFVITALTTPLLTLALAILEIVRIAIKPRRHAGGVLFLIGALFPLLVSALPSSPKYDGERLFVPAFPFLALLAGTGGAELIAMLAQWQRNGRALIHPRHALEALAIAIFGIGIISISQIHPHELTYWNALIGGLRGANAKGMETTYWGESVNEKVYQYLKDLPPKSQVQVLALNDQVFYYLQEWKILPRSLKISAEIPGDIVLLQMRQGFFGGAETMLEYLRQNGFGQAIVEKQGVPFVVAFDLRNEPEVRRTLQQFFAPASKKASLREKQP